LQKVIRRQASRKCKPRPFFFLQQQVGALVAVLATQSADLEDILVDQIRPY